MTMTFDDTIFFSTGEEGDETPIGGTDTVQFGFQAGHGHDTYYPPADFDGPVDDTTFGEEIPDPRQPDWDGDDDAGTARGPITSNEGTDGSYAGEDDGNSLDPDYYPVDEGVLDFG